MEGWVKIHRKIAKWEWYHKSEMVHLFIHFLILANHKDNKWQGQIVKRGQFITGLDSLNKATGISVQTIRTCINKLKSTGELTNQSTNRFRLITLLNWTDYQLNDDKPTSKLTSPLTYYQQSTNKQLTANKNDKNVKEEILGDKSPEEFSSKEYIEQVIKDKKPHISLIGKYFKTKGVDFPSLKAARAELVRWTKDASVLAEYSEERINKTFAFVSEKFKDEWNLSTIRKYIANN